jgi:hypothetical protein
MISASARNSFDNVLKAAAKVALVGDASQVLELVPLPEFKPHASKQSVMLTISGYLFRLRVFFHYIDDPMTRAHLGRMSRRPLEEMTDQMFADALKECANMCCGAVSRDLAQAFPHLGMSTPNILSSYCMAYLQMLHASHVQHFAVGIDQSSLFELSLCVSEYADLDFHLELAVEAQGSGELEMF